MFLMTACPSDDLVFRVQVATEFDPLKCNPGLPERSWDLTPPTRVWSLLEPEEGERRVLEGGSLLCTGIAGTGKTTYMRGLVERLRKDGKVVDIISKTHTASRRAGGVTADHWVRRHVMHGAPKCDVLWIDEISQLDVGLWLQINKLASTMQFLLSGDFNQFSPLGNTFRGSTVSESAFEDSGLLHTLSGGNKVVLTTCRRSEAVLFDFYSSLIAGGSRFELRVADAVRHARVYFPDTAPARWNLVISHQRRIRINRSYNDREASPEAVTLEVKGKAAHGNAAQTMKLWPGIQLLGCVSSEKKGMRNGCLYTVESVGADAVKLEGLGSFTFEQTTLWLRLSYAQTYASCQGTEFTESLCLWDVAHKSCSMRHLFVGMSRASQGAAVSLQN